VRLEDMDLPDPDAPDDLITFVETAAASAEDCWGTYRLR
jgi:hypothetical protein